MPAVTMNRLTKRSVDALRVGETLWDGDVRGFCCRARPKRKLFYLKLRHKGRQRWLTIGEYGAPWTVDTARKEAQRLLGELRSGAHVEHLRNNTHSDDPTIKDLCERFIEEYARAHKKANSVYTDEINIKNHILPLLGKLAVTDATRADIQEFMKDVKNGKTRTKPKRGTKQKRFGPCARGGPGAANQSLAVLSKAFNLAELWGWRPENSNPTRLVSKYPGKQINRFLSDEEIKRLGEILDQCDREGSPSPYVTATLRLLLLTGARLNEILTLKWEYVDERGGFLQLPDSKTREKVIFLNEGAIDVLNAIPRVPGNPYVMVGSIPGNHYVNIEKPWRRIRRLADLEDVRIHDLRHSFASIAAANGASLPIIGRLLGHTQSQTTQRYAHLAARPIKEANESVGRSISGLLAKEPSS